MTLELQPATRRERTDAWRAFGGVWHWSAKLGSAVEFACGETTIYLSYLLMPRTAGPPADEPESTGGWVVCEACQTAREAAGYPPFD